MSLIHPTAIIEPGAVIDPSAKIGAYCVIGAHVTIGKDVELSSHVVIEGHTHIGDHCVVESFACLGKRPQHMGYKGEPTELIIGKHNLIREHVTMHTGTQQGGGKTVIGDHGMFMAASHVAHDCLIGDHLILAQNSALGGHVQVGDNVYFGAYSAAHPFVKIGHSAIIGGLTAVVANVIPYGNVYGERGYLNGVNLIGMKRRGMSKEDMRVVKLAYESLFLSDGIFKDDLAKLEADYGTMPAVKEIIDFINSDTQRALCGAKKD